MGILANLIVSEIVFLQKSIFMCLFFFSVNVYTMYTDYSPYFCKPQWSQDGIFLPLRPSSNSLFSQSELITDHCPLYSRAMQTFNPKEPAHVVWCLVFHRHRNASQHHRNFLRWRHSLSCPVHAAVIYLRKLFSSINFHLSTWSDG